MKKFRVFLWICTGIMIPASISLLVYGLLFMENARDANHIVNGLMVFVSCMMFLTLWLMHKTAIIQEETAVISADNRRRIEKLYQ